MPSAAIAEEEVTNQRSNEIKKRGPAIQGPLAFWVRVWDALLLAGSGGVAAEDAEFAGGAADFGQGLIEARDVGGFDVDEKLIFPGAAVNRAAFDLKEIDAMLCEGFERGEERAGAVC